MKPNKKQTAVEWLVGQITYSNEYGVVRSSFDEMADLSEFIDQAKQMEREQIELAHTYGFIDPKRNPDEYYQDIYGN